MFSVDRRQTALSIERDVVTGEDQVLSTVVVKVKFGALDRPSTMGVMLFLEQIVYGLLKRENFHKFDRCFCSMYELCYGTLKPR